MFERLCAEKLPETGNVVRQVSGVRRLIRLDMIEECEPLAPHWRSLEGPKFAGGGA